MKITTRDFGKDYTVYTFNRCENWDLRHVRRHPNYAKTWFITHICPLKMERARPGLSCFSGLNWKGCPACGSRIPKTIEKFLNFQKMETTYECTNS